jgi:hypothetical protein
MMDQQVKRMTSWAAGVRAAALATALMIAAPAARAVNVVLDYTYDTSNFFGAGNPSGAVAGTQAKAALEAVASFYSGILNDTFSSIQTPPNFASSVFSGVAFFDWSLDFNHPNTGGLVTLSNQVIPANEYRIYAGARNIAGSTLGIGGPGGYNVSSDNNGQGFTQDEINQIDAIYNAFQDDVVNREEPTGFARWGGAITFDSAGTVWHYNHNTNPTAGTNDFFSVAVHELGHALGLGASDEWNALISGTGTFTGAAATSEFGSNPPLAPPDGAHWASSTMSRIYGTNTPQEAAMDPQITTGTRKRLTALDAAALTDIGWEVAAPPVEYNPADFNEDTFVNGADLTMWRGAFGINATADADGDGDSDGRDFLIWQRQLGATSIVPSALGSASAVPEPSAALLAVLGAASLLGWHARSPRQAWLKR